MIVERLQVRRHDDEQPESELGRAETTERMFLKASGI